MKDLGDLVFAHGSNELATVIIKKVISHNDVLLRFGARIYCAIALGYELTFSDGFDMEGASNIGKI